MENANAIANGSPVAPIGVIIPTYNRWDRLLQCLRHLEMQTCKDFEVFVVDDGSTDETGAQIEKYRRTAPFPMSCLHQANSGPARARNQAIAHLRSPLCLMIGDDIFATPDLVGRHLEFHQSHPAEEAAAIGLTRWSESEQVVTPHMRWLDSDGIQFSYGDLFRGVAPSWKHFYTSNLSVKTAYVKSNPFYEGFPSAGMEDIELGYRLSVDYGLQMFFLADAIAEHVHPTNFFQSCKRAVDIGAAEYVFGELWPEHRASNPRSGKRRLLSTVARHPLLLRGFAAAASLLAYVWYPNPLVGRALQFYGVLGHDRAAAVAAHRTEESLF